MDLRTKVKFKILSSLRGIGMFKKKKPTTYSKLMIRSAIKPDGTRFDHSDFVLAKQRLRGIHKHYDHTQYQTCQYDFINNTCRCGLTIDKIKDGGNCVLKSNPVQ
jgi:hypothetical protein